MRHIGDYAVIIAGGGPSGLALAAELGSHGIEVLLVEQNTPDTIAPRAKTTNVRTRTLLRRWGIANLLAHAAPFGVDFPSDVIFVTRLAGHQLAKIENASNCAPIRDARYPEHGQWIPQYKLERVLRDYVASFPNVTLRFETEFVAKREVQDRVEVQLRADGELLSASAVFLVGADGARSAVRIAIGAHMHGRYGLSRNYNIVFRAPGLAQAHGHGPAIMYWQVNSSIPSLIGPMDAGDVWFFMPTRLPEGRRIDFATAADTICAATGIEMPYEILSIDEWVASSLIADRYREGRTFLLGDACHLHPPFGGYGMNMGVSDGVDLGWKLGAVLDGWGGSALLESYEQERREIHLAVIAAAEANHAVLSNDLWSDALEDNGAIGEQARTEIGKRIVALKQREFHTLGTVLGGCYRESPIITDDGFPPPSPQSVDYVPSSRPGCLAPHFWRADGGSLYDCFGKGFALIYQAGVDIGMVQRASADATVFGCPLKAVKLDRGEGADEYPLPLTLVRPDQHVAWRGMEWDAVVLERAIGLCHEDPRPTPVRRDP